MFVIMLSYAELLGLGLIAKECQLFVRRELRLHSNANANAKLRLRLVVIFSLVREELKAV